MGLTDMREALTQAHNLGRLLESLWISAPPSELWGTCATALLAQFLDSAPGFMLPTGFTTSTRAVGRGSSSRFARRVAEKRSYRFEYRRTPHRVWRIIGAVRRRY